VFGDCPATSQQPIPEPDLKKILNVMRRLLGDPRVSSRIRFAVKTSLPGRLFPDRQESSCGYTEQTIDDDWFRAHFIYAPDVVAHWLRESVKAPTETSVLDFGCGDGIMALGMRLRHDLSYICGVDLHESNRYLADTASKQIGLRCLPPGIEFMVIDGRKSLLETVGRKFDFIYSWSVFEHIALDLLPGILREVKQALSDDGRFFLQIEPLYYSPFGSHLGGVVSNPWAHLLLPEEELTKEVFGFDLENLKGEFKNKTFEECSTDDFKKYLFREYRSLNRITSRELVDCCVSAGFSVVDSWKNEVNIEPPAQLLEKYPREDLITSEIRLLLE
jgi:SAM-dependent methyltransferase